MFEEKLAPVLKVKLGEHVAEQLLSKNKRAVKAAEEFAWKFFGVKAA